MSKDDEKLIELDCGHEFCNSCLINYFAQKIVNVNLIDVIRCAACYFVIADDLVSKMLKPETHETFEKLKLRNFVITNKKFTFCPADGCDKVIKSNSSVLKGVICECGERFCFNCGPEHDHVPCEMMKMWLNLPSNPNDILSKDYMTSYAKSCPYCGVNILKEKGCKIVTCTECHCDFCFTCLSFSKDHTNGCNNFAQYETELFKFKPTREAFNFTNDHKFYFFFERYGVNNKKKIYFKKKIEEASIDEMKVLRKIIDCCKILGEGYIFACFMAMCPEKINYEDYLKKLEAEVCEVFQLSLRRSKDEKEINKKLL